MFDLGEGGEDLLGIFSDALVDLNGRLHELPRDDEGCVFDQISEVDFVPMLVHLGLIANAAQQSLSLLGVEKVVCDFELTEVPLLIAEEPTLQ